MTLHAHRLLCSYCGHEVPYATPADRAAALTAANAHAATCASSPLVRRIRELESELTTSRLLIEESEKRRREQADPEWRKQQMAMVRELIDAAQKHTITDGSPCRCRTCSEGDPRRLSWKGLNLVADMVLQARIDGKPAAVRVEFSTEQGMGCTVVAAMNESQWARLASAAGVTP